MLLSTAFTPARRAFFALLAIGCVSCGPEEERAAPPPAVPQGASAKPPPSKDPLMKALAERAEEETPRMSFGQHFQGELKASSPDHRRLVLKSDRCYAALAQASPEIDDLDLMLFNPNHVLLRRDTSTSRQPRVGAEDPVCPGRAGVYRLQIEAAKAGRYALQIMEIH